MEAESEDGLLAHSSLFRYFLTRMAGSQLANFVFIRFNIIERKIMEKKLFYCLSLMLTLNFVSLSAFAGGKLINEELATPRFEQHKSCPVDYRVDEKSKIAKSNLTRRHIVEFLYYGVGRKIRQACDQLGAPPKGIRHVILSCGTSTQEKCTDKEAPGAFKSSIVGDTLLIQGKYESCTCANKFSSIEIQIDKLFL